MDKEDSSYSELNDLAKENANAIETVEKERSNVESEMSDKFDEVLSKERGTDEYKDALQEYNALKDQKAELDEKYSSLSERQDALERKSAELREAQIAKGNEAISESDNSLATAKVLEEKFDSTYYEAKIDSKALEQLSDENSALISELSSEKDAIKLAMDAKMDEISQYVSSNDMGRYETSVDPYYQKLNSEYLAMKSAYEKVDCSIVKLDENNRLMTEILPEDRKFGIYKVDENGFVKGANYNQYIDVWNNYSEEKNKVEMFDRPEIVTISPSLVEGIRLSEYDISNPSDFWSQHMSGGTEESFRDIAAQIPIVKKELDSGKSLSDIMENPELSECANIYFNPKNIPDVIKCGDYYEFQGNGRHRILAARNEGHDMSVNVVGERNYERLENKSEFEYNIENKSLQESISNFFGNLFGKSPHSISDSTEQYTDMQSSPNEVLNSEKDEIKETDIKSRFDKLKDKEFSELNETEQKELVNIAVDNLKQKYGDAIPNERFEKIRSSIMFVDSKTVAQDCNVPLERANRYLGYYSPVKDDIKINISADNQVDTILTTLDHEAMHMLTEKLDGSYITGIKTNSPFIPRHNVGMNEGLTELYSIRNIQELNQNYVSYSYVSNVEIMKNFESSFGKDRLKKAYMTNDFAGVSREYDSYMGVNSFQNFCNLMDSMHDDFNSDRYLSGNKKKEQLSQMLDIFKARKGDNLC